MNKYADAAHAQYTPAEKENIQEEAGYSHPLNPHRDEELPDRSLTLPGARAKILKAVKSGATASGVPQQQSYTTKDIYKVMKQHTEITQMLVKHQ